MAIAFSNVGHNSVTVASGAASTVVTVTINAGDTVVVCIGIAGGTTRTVASVVDSAGNTGYAQKVNIANSSANQSFIWASFNVASPATTVTVTTNNPGAVKTDLVVVVITYTGLGTNGFGTTHTSTGNSSTPNDSLTTQDTNNFVVMCAVQNAAASITFSANTGNLRDQASISGGFNAFTANCGNDNTAASATSVLNKVTSTRSQTWSACSLELRSTDISFAGDDSGISPSPKFVVSNPDPIITVWQ